MLFIIFFKIHLSILLLTLLSSLLAAKCILEFWQFFHTHSDALTHLKCMKTNGRTQLGKVILVSAFAPFSFHYAANSKGCTSNKTSLFPHSVWNGREAEFGERIWQAAKEQLQTEFQITLDTLQHYVNQFKEQLAEKDQQLISALHDGLRRTITHFQTTTKLAVTEDAVGESQNEEEAQQLSLLKHRGTAARGTLKRMVELLYQQHESLQKLLCELSEHQETRDQPST